MVQLFYIPMYLQKSRVYLPISTHTHTHITHKHTHIIHKHTHTHTHTHIIHKHTHTHHP